MMEIIVNFIFIFFCICAVYFIIFVCEAMDNIMLSNTYRKIQDRFFKRS